MASIHHQGGNNTGTRSGRGYFGDFIDWGSVHTGNVIEQEEKKRGQGGRTRDGSDIITIRAGEAEEGGKLCCLFTSLLAKT
jgi:hypothetical protein